MTFKNLIAVLILVLLGLSASAQKGTHILQVSGQTSIPTGDLADAVDVGLGGALKGMLGFGKTPQQITLETGYNFFNVKNLPASVNANYSSVPIYLGYRANLGQIILEGQAGVALNHIEGVGPLGTVSSNQTAFGWAIAAGYEYKNFELDVRYQNSEADSDTDVIRFVGIRLAYNFTL